MLNKTPNLEKDGQTKLCPLKSSNSFLFVHTLHMTSPWPTAQGTLVPCRCTCKTLLSGWSIANNPLFLSDFKWSSSGCKRRCLGQAIPIRSLLQHVYGYIRLAWIYFFCAEVTLGAVWCTPKSKRAGYTTRVFVPSVGERSTCGTEVHPIVGERAMLITTRQFWKTHRQGKDHRYWHWSVRFVNGFRTWKVSPGMTRFTACLVLLVRMFQACIFYRT